MGGTFVLTSIMASNRALSKHVLIQDVISSELQDNKALKDIHTGPS
jgi:hypothetical protein